ncbi:MAG: NAD(P)/FAD-dependent oxidoreductase [Hyphomicrobiales bacterium]
MPRPQRHDVLIAGAGPGGIAAAFCLRGFGLDALLLEAAMQPGGQLHEIHAAVRDFPLAYGWDGRRLTGSLLADARAAEIPILVGAPVRRLSVRGRWLERGEGRDAERFHARAILIATGLTRRRLGVPGEDELAGRGVSVSANRDRERFAGLPVAVVGGGTAAVEDALLCADVGCDVTLLHRSTRFRARSDFLARLKAHPRIRVVTRAAVTKILGRDQVEGISFRVGRTRAERTVAVRGVFVRIGWDPCTEFLRGALRLDRDGYVRAGEGGRTSAPWVWAAGDVCSPRWPSIANAMGQGAAAGWDITRALGRLPR